MPVVALAERATAAKLVRMDVARDGPLPTGSAAGANIHLRPRADDGPRTAGGRRSRVGARRVGAGARVLQLFEIKTAAEPGHAVHRHDLRVYGIVRPAGGDEQRPRRRSGPAHPRVQRASTVPRRCSPPRRTGLRVRRLKPVRTVGPALTAREEPQRSLARQVPCWQRPFLKPGGWVGAAGGGNPEALARAFRPRPWCQEFCVFKHVNLSLPVVLASPAAQAFSVTPFVTSANPERTPTTPSARVRRQQVRQLRSPKQPCTRPANGNVQVRAAPIASGNAGGSAFPGSLGTGGFASRAVFAGSEGSAPMRFYLSGATTSTCRSVFVSGLSGERSHASPSDPYGLYGQRP